MNTESAALSIARAYHNSWTSRDFEEAVGLLASDLRVEVPINDYPTKESFAAALIGFGRLVASVTLLAEFGGDSDALLLYDMEVKHLGRLRVAEHFTISDGRIGRDPIRWTN